MILAVATPFERVPPPGGRGPVSATVVATVTNPATLVSASMPTARPLKVLLKLGVGVGVAVGVGVGATAQLMSEYA